MKPLIIAIAIARALDAASTCQALHYGTEGNPLLPSSCKTVVAVESSLTVMQAYGLTKLAVTHPKLAMIVSAVTLGLESYAVVHNASIAKVR
jgi:hypothetical protein